MLRIQLVALVLAATSLAASGCGGSSKTSPATTTEKTATTPPASTAAVTQPPAGPPVKVATGTPLSRARFIASANVICARMNKKLNAVSVITTKEFGRVLPQVIIYDRTELGELSKLVPPAAMTRDWSQIIKDLQVFEAYTRTVSQYAQANNIKAAGPIIERSNHTHQHMIGVAARNGLKSCATEEDPFG